MADLDEPIHLSAYDPQWPLHFEVERQRLSAVLPVGSTVEHIGSTSVPGLLAKPILDIMVGWERRHDREAMRKALSNCGYEDLGEAGVPGRLYFRHRREIAFNIALVQHGGSLWAANLAFRHYLRTSAEARLEYAETKRRAFASGIRSLLAYSDFKTEVLSRLMNQALEHRLPEWTNDQPSGGSDQSNFVDDFLLARPDLTTWRHS